MVLYFGSAIFKITRLLFVAMSAVHVFACVFYRVKRESVASTEDFDQFFLSRNVSPNVSTPIKLFINSRNSVSNP
jgi:hypothetical protein